MTTMKRKPLTSQAGLVSAVDYLLREFRSLNQQPDLAAAIGSTYRFTGPIEPSYLVASADARAEIRAVADFVCSGTDDQAEIEAALALLAPTGGGRVVLTEGTFSFTERIKFPAYPVHLMGMGPQITKIVNGAQITTDTACFIETANYEVLIEGIGFTYTRTGTSNHYLVNLWNDATIRDCHFAFWGTGFVEWSDYCLSLGGQHAVVENCYFYPTGVGVGGVGCWFPHCRIVNNHFALLSDGPAMEVWGDDNLIIGNTVDGTPGTTVGIYLNDERNVVVGNTIYDTTGEGIWAEFGNDNLIASNHVSSTGKTGILIDSGCDENLIVGNRVDWQPTGYNGIRVVGWNCSVVGNYVADGAGAEAAIYVTGQDASVVGNYSLNSPGDGIYVTADRTLIETNRVVDAAGDGIEITSAADGCMIGSNLVTGSTGTDYIDDGTNTIHTDAPLVVTADPSSPWEGQIVVNTTANKVRVWMNGAWRTFAMESMALTGTGESASDGAGVVTIT